MAELAGKGASAAIESIKQLLVTMKWTSAVDFDLFALWKAKDGTKGIVYFSDMGNLNAKPFMKLDKDAGVGDTGGDNKETMRIEDLSTMERVHIGCWDYGAVQGGTAARFAGSDLKITIMAQSGEKNDVPIVADAMGNVILLAEIDNSSPMGAKLINEGKSGTIKKLDDTLLWRIAEAA